MHFRSAHDCEPVEWVNSEYGSEIREQYASGSGSYTIAEKYEWLSSDMVCELVETRSRGEALEGENNPMKRDDVASQFSGENNPAKRPEVREKLRKSAKGNTHSKQTKEKISRKNSGNVVSEAHREKISEAASNRDTSYMQTEEYSRALSESLKGREPTYPTPRNVVELSHIVRSSWEEKIAMMLVENEIPYIYEKEFQLSVGSYYVDFVIDTIGVEIKGFSTERSIKKAKSFMEEFPTYTYVVVGDEIPCNIHIPWDKRSELLEVLNNE